MTKGKRVSASSPVPAGTGRSRRLPEGVGLKSKIVISEVSEDPSHRQNLPKEPICHLVQQNG
jgi:hypothetical protein